MSFLSLPEPIAALTQMIVRNYDEISAYEQTRRCPVYNTQITENYDQDGFITGVNVLSTEEVSIHRAALEQAEKKIGSLHYLSKIHTILRSPYELATHPRLINAVETILGPDILLYNVTYIIKEPRTPNFVSWHQDLTYWGFDSDDQVSAWLALSPATAESGCMRMIPGSHRKGMREQLQTNDSNNVLLLGQTIPNIPENKAVLCSLNPGEASLHHGWTIHSSTPNSSSDRRIGVNIQYIKPCMYQKNTRSSSALLIRGEDSYGHFSSDPLPPNQIPADAIEQITKRTEIDNQITKQQSRL